VKHQLSWPGPGEIGRRRRRHRVAAIDPSAARRRAARSISAGGGENGERRRRITMPFDGEKRRGMARLGGGIWRDVSGEPQSPAYAGDVAAWLTACSRQYRRHGGGVGRGGDGVANRRENRTAAAASVYNGGARQPVTYTAAQLRLSSLTRLAARRCGAKKCIGGKRQNSSSAI